MREVPARIVTPAGTPRRPLTSGFFRLAQVVQVMLRLNALLALAEICYHVWAINELGRWIDDPATYTLSTAKTIDNLDRIDGISISVLALLIGVLFIAWLYQANRSDRVDPLRLRRGAGWSIGGWFIPFANLALPFQQVSDVHRAALAARGGDQPMSGSTVIGWWWALWLCSGITGWIAVAANSSSADDTRDAVQVIRDVRTENVTALIASIATLAAALLAVAVVRRVTALLRRP